MNDRLVLLFVIASLGFAPAPFPGDDPSAGIRPDLKAIQGVWRVKSYFVAGRKIDSIAPTVEFAGNRMIFRSNGKNGPNRVEWTFTLKASCSKRRVRRFDLPGADATAQGIYRLEDELTISIALPDQERPNDFRPASARWHIVLERPQK
jgi:uncharacterized protein (TIGR03067 family)